ncbi:hypothetical protein AX16_005367 [Volvariella volvacea WC 439]|nr:hypothetical protein AX16_005367 [Volvariella volvacea WC 439]
MESNAAPPIPSSSSAPPEVTNSQAGPLPVKRGEIGYQEAHQEALQQSAGERSPSPLAPLPARHPADRDAPPDPDPSSSQNSSAAPPANAPFPTGAQKQRWLNFLRPKKVPAWSGMRLTTLILFAAQWFLFVATIAGWVLATRRIRNTTESSDPGAIPTSAIFIHVIFGVAILGQLLFLERRVYRLRAERYSYLHPGELLPTSHHDMSTDPIIAFSPWNRPPLPTYAAALAQSGVGTGDVEDHLIAAPPPPAYGNTRGSKLLLSGYLRESLRAQRPPSVHSLSSQQDRPLSYVSHEQHDMEQAQLRRQETLARLERATSRRST